MNHYLEKIDGKTLLKCAYQFNKFVKNQKILCFLKKTCL